MCLLQQSYNHGGCVAVVYEPGSKLIVLGMVIPPLIENPYKSL